jgi:hypothetical protein
VRRTRDADEWVELSTADPSNLSSIVGDAARAAPGSRLVFRNGAVVAAESAPRQLASSEPTSAIRRESLRR